jgi:hypothetical protein
MSLQAGIYAVTILVGAFLLFQIELIMGKFLLPRFGGGPSVWSTSLLVFQVLLLAGYGYAAFICAVFRPRTQAIIHLCLLGRQYRGSPYRLYALSNLGSMLGLLTYPLLVERTLTLSQQAWVWDIGYAVFLLVAAKSAFTHMGRSAALEARLEEKPARRGKVKESSESQPEFCGWPLPPVRARCY